MGRALLRAPHNHRTFNRSDVVADYARADALLPPEIVALDTLHRDIARPSVLDIGVGGGRTAAAFSERAIRYVGIDYSDAMILACKNRFADSATPLEFCVGDARSLLYEDGSFNFVLFSFNGIDYMDHNDRLQALREIYRVCVPGAIFCFSSHNLWSVKPMYDALTSDRKGPYRKLTGVLHRAVLQKANPPLPELLSKPYSMVNDGVHHFGLRSYYANPNEVLSQLTDAGFESEMIFDKRGDAVEQPVTASCTDSWLTHLCRRPQVRGVAGNPS